MDIIPLSTIGILPSRQRRTIDPSELNSLIQSILDTGLLHPIVVRKEGEDLLWLVAGERRLQAIKSIHDLGKTFRHNGQRIAAGSIPITYLSDMTPLKAKEAELEENIQRTDLTWQEKAAAIKEIKDTKDQIRTLEFGGAPLLIRELSDELAGMPGTHRKNLESDLLIARNLDKPEVRNAATKQDALKALQRLEQLEQSRKMAELVGRDYSPAVHRLIRADSKEWLRTVPDASYKVICTDPPFGMGADEFGDSGRAGAYRAHTYEDSEQNFLDILHVCQEELFRIALPAAHLYWFCDLDNFHKCRSAFTLSGWRVFRTPLIWHKPSGFRTPWVNAGPQRKYECILYAQKGELKTLRLGGDVLSHGPDAQLNHPAQKPVALYADLLSRSCLAGDSILDPFCGSGPIFDAATQLQLRATGVEGDATAYGIAAQRIAAQEEK